MLIVPSGPRLHGAGQLAGMTHDTSSDTPGAPREMCHEKYSFEFETFARYRTVPVV